MKKRKLIWPIQFLIENMLIHDLEKMNRIFGYEVIVENGRAVKVGVELA